MPRRLISRADLVCTAPASRYRLGYC